MTALSKIFMLALIFFSLSSYAAESCDDAFHKAEKSCNDMVCRDKIVNDWAECWRKDMNTELDKRLLSLKNIDPTEFHAEMELQKNFNQATEQVCGKNCGAGGTMKGIPYNFCRVDAYKYRTAQAQAINNNQLVIPINSNLDIKKSDTQKTKETQFYKIFTHQLCQLPKSVWQGKNPPADCEKNAYTELDSFDFTNDVCDLS